MANMRIPKSLWSWAFYDFANSAYVLIYSSFLLPVFFSTVLLSQGYSLHSWGFANGISTVMGVLLSIVVGRHADVHSRYRAFTWSIIASFAGMIAVSVSVQYIPAYLFTAYIIANSVFILSLSLSDSILPYVADRAASYDFSGFAWGFGYLGGIASLLIVIPLQRLTGEYSFAVFSSVAVFYAIFSAYALRGLRTVPLNEKPKPQAPSLLTPKEKIILLFGYWLISECVTVILLFYSIFLSQELGLSNGAIGILLLIVQLIAFPATWYGGVLAKGSLSLTMLGLTILCWGLAIALLVLHTGWFGLAGITILGGLAVGNSQSILRAQYATLIDRSESGYQFGMYAIISEGAVFIGPILYAYASEYLHSQKIPLIALFFLMVLGYLIIVRLMKRKGTTVWCP